MTLLKACQLSLLFGVLSLLAVCASILALQDISKGRETDLSLEWNFLRVSFLIIIAFHAVALATLWKADRAEHSRHR